MYIIYDNYNIHTKGNKNNAYKPRGKSHSKSYDLVFVHGVKDTEI